MNELDLRAELVRLFGANAPQVRVCDTLLEAKTVADSFYEGWKYQDSTHDGNRLYVGVDADTVKLFEARHTAESAQVWRTDFDLTDKG